MTGYMTGYEIIFNVFTGSHICRVWSAVGDRHTVFGAAVLVGFGRIFRACVWVRARQDTGVARGRVVSSGVMHRDGVQVL
jgi:hypothetical protein